MAFEAMLRLVGMSDAETARYLGVPLRRVRRWIEGVPASHGALQQLRKLADRQDEVAEALAEAWVEAGRPDEIAFAVAENDEAAEAMGWPSVGAQRAAAARAQVEIAPAYVKICPIHMAAQPIAAE